MRALPTWLAAMSAVIAAGCATPPAPVPAPEPAQKPLAAYSEMRFQPFDLDKAADVALGPEGHPFAFPEGPRHYTAIALPRTERPRFLAFRVYTSGVMLSSISALIPKAVFLDQDKQVIQTTTATGITRTPDFWRNFAYHGRVPAPPAAAYAVLYPADEVIPPLVVHSANGTAWRVALARSGEMQLRVTDQGVATVADWGIRESSSKAQLFVIERVNGQAIRNATVESRQVSTGTGFQLNTAFTVRELPASKQRVTLVGTHQTGAPVQAMLNQASGTFLTVRGEVDFTPQPGRQYVVKGILKPEGSSVWIEDAETGAVVTEKVVSGSR